MTGARLGRSLWKRSGIPYGVRSCKLSFVLGLGCFFRVLVLFVGFAFVSFHLLGDALCFFLLLRSIKFSYYLPKKVHVFWLSIYELVTFFLLVSFRPRL